MWIWLIAMACDQPVAEDVGPSVPPAERLAAIDADLTLAYDVWLTEDVAQASMLTQRAYLEHFQPMEPLLRQHEPHRTLVLEYRFGRLMKAVQQTDTHIVVAQSVTEIRDEVTELVEMVDPTAVALAAPTTVEQTQQNDAEQSQ